MPYQQALVPASHIAVGQATIGATVVYQGQSAYDFEVTNAGVAGLVSGHKYTIADVFTSIGDPTVALTGVAGSWDMQMFTLFVALFGLKTAAITAAGSGGSANGTFALPIPAAPVGGVNATGTFTVAGGVVTAVNITNQGSGYANQNVVINNAALVTAGATGLTGATITLTAGQVN